jgi:hypothetical protein
MRVGISFVDVAGARRNLQAEAPDFDFDRMRRRARSSWNRTLSKVRVTGGSAAELKTFYTALYHAQLHPNVFTDVDVYDRIDLNVAAIYPITDTIAARGELNQPVDVADRRLALGRLTFHGQSRRTRHARGGVAARLWPWHC